MGNDLGRHRRGAGRARQGGRVTGLTYKAAVLHAAQTPMSVETVTLAGLKLADVLVKIRAAGLCHTDLEVIEGGGTVMVIGCGAVGLAAVQGARLAGAGTIIAVDIDPAKLSLAAKMGATLGIDASKDDPADGGRRATGGRGVMS